MKLKIIVPIVAVVIVLVLAIILLNGIITDKADKVILIGYSKYSQQWIDIKNGAISAGGKSGVDIAAIACDSKQKTLDQIGMIEDAISEDIKAIILMPTNLNLLENVIGDIKRRKINLIILDDSTAINEYAYFGTSIDVLGIKLAEDIEKAQTKPINVACIFTYDDSGKSVALYDSFKQYSDSSENINIVSESVSASDFNLAASIARNIISEKKADYIVCFDETITEGVASSIKNIVDEKGKRHIDIKVAGLGFADSCAKYIEDDIIISLAIQNYYGMGYLALSNYNKKGIYNIFAEHAIAHKSDIFNGNLSKILFEHD
jgi:ABC-type sugar transport system substrate-binding protein